MQRESDMSFKLIWRKLCLSCIVENRTFNNTPFNTIYSYMKHTNIPSSQTAISYGCKQIEEFADEVNDVTKVFAITREEWNRLCSLK